MRLKEDDIDLLVPSMRPVIRALRAALVSEGFDPCVRDTLRTQAEADRNAKLGTGSARSVHMWGVAADFVCQQHHWDCAEHGCDFYKRLGALAEEAGLVWGGRWPKRDMPHVQGVSVAGQAALRKLSTGPKDEAARDRLVVQWLQRARVPRR